MNAVLELVFWGAPAVLLSWGLFLVIACAMVFFDETGETEDAKSGRLSARA